ncbi:MAG: hypothetical protein KC561_14800 [Myxococcales bacterium]|nr:hypothetical protein [Myxococcales bacterium]
MYVATDSRLSWSAHDGSVLGVWDQGRKVFASRTRPIVCGYQGDVLFPSMILSQFIDALDHGAGSKPRRHGVLFDELEKLVRDSHGAQPAFARRAPFQVVYGARVGEKMGSEFQVYYLRWTGKTWQSGPEALPAASEPVVIWGSGRAAVKKWRSYWDRSSQGGTSRAIFSAFSDAIDSKTDRLSGGASQLVGLYRIGDGQAFGTFLGDSAHVFGLPAGPFIRSGIAPVEWRNRYLERCNSNGDLVKGAKVHHVPKGLGGT